MLRLFTSIRPPADPAEASWLQSCAASWSAAGFDVVAVNASTEVEKLQSLDLPVSFSVLPVSGKPRIGAILSAIRKDACKYAGFINSDCRIAGYPGLASSINNGLNRSCMLAWRIDVGDGDPTAVSHGFDAYFFDTRFLPDDDLGFFIGDVWWDYWFPIACEMKGAKLQTLGFPLLIHKIHPLNWKQRKWDDGAARLWGALQTWRPQLSGSLLDEIPVTWWKQRQLTATQVGRLSLIIPAWLFKERPQTGAILPKEMAEVEMMLRAGGQALLDGSEFTLMRKMVRRAIKPLRMAVAAVRRARSTAVELAVRGRP